MQRLLNGFEEGADKSFCFCEGSTFPHLNFIRCIKSGTVLKELPVKVRTP